DIDSRTGKARGIRIRAIKPGSMANSFGILQDDVIISINDQRVTSQARAVNVVKAELRKKPTPSFIQVKLLRYGREKTLRFDTRDPDTRRKARDAFRNRR
ncbi:MAG: PDZ domain-containing protein, partial [Planctomycetota bacterium]